MRINITEIIVVLFLAILIFGPTQIPKLIGIWKKEKAEVKNAAKKDMEA